jgi:hypothetical protein
METRQLGMGAWHKLEDYLTSGGHRKKQRRTGLKDKRKSSFQMVLILLSLFSCTVSANTIFVADRGGQQVDIFHVGDNLAISHIKVLDYSNASYGLGPIDLAMDEVSQTVFVSFETTDSAGTKRTSSKIALIDFNTLTHIKTIDFPQASDFGGLCYDSNRHRLYAVERNTNQVYILKWHPETLTLEYEQLIQLSNIQYACAIQVDGDIAYITEYRYQGGMLYYNYIKQYDLSNNWSYVRTIPNREASTCLAFDRPRQILYSGAYDYSGTLHHIIKHTLDPNGIIVKDDTDPDIGCMIDGDIDESSGYLYITSNRGTFRVDLRGRIEIWDTSSWTDNPSQAIAPLAVYENAAVLAGPAGILFVDHDPRPWQIEITKEDGLNPNEPNDWVFPNDVITYTITVDPNDPNEVAHTNMVVVDYLPPEVDYDPLLNQQPVSAPPPADPNIIFEVTDANGLDEITLPVGQSIRLYVTKDTVNTNLYAFGLEVNNSDPNLGWIDNTEYDPNDPNASTAEILATPRDTGYDYYGPGYTQEEGIQFSAVSFSNPMQDGDLASFIYTATQPGYVVLSLVDYSETATLHDIVICQTDPNDPNVPGDPNILPAPPAAPPAGVYDPQTHTVTWHLGSVSQAVVLTLKVRVNSKAEPMGTLFNEVAVSSDTGFGWTYEITQVGCFGGNIIYVDKKADEGGNGTSWVMAYRELSDALNRAAKGCGVTEIWVAQGVYSPGPKVTDTFEIPAGKSVYGGFIGTEIERDLRNPKLYPTVLSGYIRTLGSNEERNEDVVDMKNNSLLDGVTVEKGKYRGIKSSNSEIAIGNSVIAGNGQYGIYAENGDANISLCRIINNGWDGIRFLSNYSNQLRVENCDISNNIQNGINCLYSASTIINSVICHNGSDSSIYEQYYGVKIAYSPYQAVLRNNTIVCNQNAGIYYNGTPNKAPRVKNCILWSNAPDNQFKDIEGFTQTIHCCLTDPNNPDVVVPNPTSDALGNIITAPKFAYPDPGLGNFHLAYDSPCVDAGDPNETYEEAERDMDLQGRIYNQIVDIGADEVDCGEYIYNICDWNADGVVNYAEFSMLSHAWLAVGNSDPNFSDPNYNPVCDLNDDWVVDTGDLAEFIPNWLWKACWRYDLQETQQQSMMMGGGQQMIMSAISPTIEFSQSLEITFPAVIESTEASPTTESVETEVFDPVAEKEIILSLLEDIEVFIDAGGEDAHSWQEIKVLLEQSLTEIEDTVGESVTY